MRTTPLARIDPGTAETLKRFGLRLGFLAFFSIILTWQTGHSFAGLFNMASLFSCLSAAVGRQPIGRGPLNQWDEAIAFFALQCLFSSVQPIAVLVESATS